MNADSADQRRFTNHFLWVSEPALAAMARVGSVAQIRGNQPNRRSSVFYSYQSVEELRQKQLALDFLNCLSSCQS